MNQFEKAMENGCEALLSKISESGLREYGTSSEKIADKIAEKKPEAVLGALCNSDTDHVLLKIASEYPEKILSGLAILGKLSDTDKLLLVLPEGEEELGRTFTEKAQEMKLDLSVMYGIVDVRRNRMNQIYHLVTLLAVSDIAEGTYKPGTWVSVQIVRRNETAGTDPVFVSYGTVPNALLSSEVSDAKAVQIGEHLYPPSALKKPITEEMAVSGGVIRIFCQNTCMLASMEKLLQKKREQACGKCTFCREGLNQIWTRMHEITTGHGDSASPDIMREIGGAMPFSTQCSMGQTASLAVLDTLDQFENEYTDHIKWHKCTAGQCLAFVSIGISPSKCTGCGKCIEACPADCIEGLPGFIHMIEDTECTKCGKCMDACEEKAIVLTDGKPEAVPDRLTRVGHFSKLYVW